MRGVEYTHPFTDSFFVCNSVIPTGDLSEVTRNYRNLTKRYPNMYIPTDFVSLESSWIRAIKPRGPAPRPLFITTEAVDFEVTNIKGDDKEKEKEKAGDSGTGVTTTPAPVVVTQTAEPGVSPSGKRYSVRVALLNAVPAEDLINAYVPHLARQLKFLVQEKEGIFYIFPSRAN
jgi:hypothetical protein